MTDFINFLIEPFYYISRLELTILYLVFAFSVTLGEIVKGNLKSENF